MHINRLVIASYAILMMCVAVLSASDLQVAVLQEVSHVLGESSFYTCKQRQGTLAKSICSCDPSCNRYGDCCIDIAEDVPRERYMCTQLASHGPYVWVKASCGGRPVPSWMKVKCEGQFTGNFPFSSFQFLSDKLSFHKPSGILYRNIYCVVCNGGHQNETYDWGSKIEWVGESPGKLSAPSQLQKMQYDAKRGVYWMMHAGIMYIATVQSPAFEWKNFTRAFNTTECSPTVDECPKGSDPVLAQKCALYAAYYTPSDAAQVTYKNYHCALCNGVSLATVEEDGERAKFIQSLIIPSLDKPASDISSSQLDQRTHHNECDEGQIRLPGLNSCRVFGCRGGTVKGIGGCQRSDGTHSCAWILLEEHQVPILPNRTLHVNFSDETVSLGDYEIDSWTGHSLVCVPYNVTVVPDSTQTSIQLAIIVPVAVFGFLFLILVPLAVYHRWRFCFRTYIVSRWGRQTEMKNNMNGAEATEMRKYEF
ncbi:uncharacterized protein LOC135392031 [Ornithodoros turicata]|uniref:uncharacterized protein LOC135392031 n=1 Tax=Ornithodoros turicata TaxID=34597 RepID=UPI003139A166